MKLEIGNHQIEHTHYFDDMGIKRDSIEVIETLEDGNIVHYPIIPPLKVQDYNLDIIFMDASTEYTEEELRDILETYIKKDE